MDEISRDEAMSILHEVPVAHLGMVEDGEPYVTPMSFVVDGETILFRTMPGRKLDALRSKPAVCIEVSTYDELNGDWTSVIVRGNAVECEDRTIRENTVSLLYRKYDKAMGSPLERGGLQPLAGLPHVIKVDIDQISGMSSGRGFSAKTKPGRL